MTKPQSYQLTTCAITQTLFDIRKSFNLMYVSIATMLEELSKGKTLKDLSFVVIQHGHHVLCYLILLEMIANQQYLVHTLVFKFHRKFTKTYNVLQLLRLHIWNQCTNQNNQKKITIYWQKPATLQDRIRFDPRNTMIWELYV